MVGSVSPITARGARARTAARGEQVGIGFPTPLGVAVTAACAGAAAAWRVGADEHRECPRRRPRPHAGSRAGCIVWRCGIARRRRAVRRVVQVRITPISRRRARRAPRAC